MVKRNRIPTKVGDVLILHTCETFHLHAVGSVYKDGQQDFAGRANVNHIVGRPAALVEAKALVIPGRRIYLLEFDSGEWSEILR